MQTRDMIEVIIKLIKEHDAVLESNEPISAVSSVEALKQACVVEEWKSLRAARLRIFESYGDNHVGVGRLQAAFKAHCVTRNEAIKGTPLSYIAMPESIGNAVHWEIAKVLCEEKTLGEVMSLLMPGTKLVEVVWPENLLPAGPGLTQQDRVQIHWEEKELGSLRGPADISVLREMITADDKVMRLDPEAENASWYHEKLYRSCPVAYQGLVKKLYGEDIGLTIAPRKMIQEWLFDLKRSGKQMTGVEYAKETAWKACERFQAYLNQLPIETQAAIKALKGSDNKTIDDVIKHVIELGQCTDQGSGYLDDILRSNVAGILDTAIVKMRFETNKRLLEMAREEPLEKMPDTDVASALSRVEMENESDVISLLISLPEETYSLLLRNVRYKKKLIISSWLMNFIRESMRPSQQKAFESAVIDCIRMRKTTLADLNATDQSTVLHDAVEKYSAEVLKALLETLPEQDRLSAVKARDNDQYTVLDSALANKNPDVLKALLETLPEQDRLSAVREKNNGGYTVLHVVAASNRTPDVLNSLLVSLPEDDRLSVVKEKDKNGRTVLHVAAAYNQTPAVLKAALMVLPEQNRLSLVLEKDNHGETAMHAAAKKHPEVLKALLETLPEHDRLSAVQERDNDGETAPQVIAKKYPEALKALLMLLPEQDRLSVVKNLFRERVLDITAAFNQTTKALKALLMLLPEQDRLLAVKEKFINRRTVLHVVAYNDTLWVLDDLKGLLETLPEQDRLSAVQEKDNDGATVLHVAARCNKPPEKFKALLMLLPEKDRLSAVQEKNQYEETVLRVAAAKTTLAVFRALLSCLSEADQYAVGDIFSPAARRVSTSSATMFGNGSSSDKSNVNSAVNPCLGRFSG